jgi:hypothetical protein
MHLLKSVGYLEVVLCTASLCAITWKKQWADFWALGSFLAVRLGSSLTGGFLIASAHHLTKAQRVVAFHRYFYDYWASYALESILSLMIIYGVFRLAMAPLKGLQNLGMLVFRWAAVISVAVAIGSAFTPGAATQDYLLRAIEQMQRTQSILTLCLLVFVCFAIRPMGLSYSSRIFGVSLGLGFLSTNNLVQAAWFSNKSGIHTVNDVINGAVICATMAIWTSYFALPEPKRRLIVLPTTSPFLRWNQISLALGDSPGHVAVGGVPPDLFSPAELEVMRRASVKMAAPFPESMGA